MLVYISAIVCALLFIGIDQLTKLFIISNFSLGQSADFINGLINIVYIHNKGAAWGIFSGKTWPLIAVTVVIMAVCIVLLIRNFGKNKLMTWSLSLVISGGIGNLIDRIFREGNVIDFLQFDFYKSFPIFNVADCCIVVGACLLILCYLLETIQEIKAKQSLKGENNGEV